MIKVVTNLREEMLKVCDKVFTTEVKNAGYPYITFKLDTIDKKGIEEIYLLEIQLWDKSTDIVVIETLADDLIEILDKYVYLNTEEGYLINAYYRGRNTLSDPVENIQRRLIRYNLAVNKIRGL